MTVITHSKNGQIPNSNSWQPPQFKSKQKLMIFNAQNMFTQQIQATCTSPWEISNMDANNRLKWIAQGSRARRALASIIFSFSGNKMVSNVQGTYHDYEKNGCEDKTDVKQLN